MPTEFHWHPDQTEFTIRAPLVNFVVRFTPDSMAVVAELSLAAKALATQQHRRDAVQFIDSIATDLGL